MTPDEQQRLADTEAKVAALEAQSAALLAQVTSLNTAVMDRLKLFGLGAGHIAAVRRAIEKLEEDNE